MVVVDRVFWIGGFAVPLSSVVAWFEVRGAKWVE